MAVWARITGTITIPTSKHISLSDFIMDNLTACNKPIIETVRKDTNYIHSIDISFVGDNMYACEKVQGLFIALKPFAKNISLIVETEWRL